jgi:hypothetical protein
MTFSNIKEAEIQLCKSIKERGFDITKNESIEVDRNKYGSPILHTRIFSERSLYHLKFQRSEHLPLEDNQVRTAHAENDRLKHAIRSFGRGNKTDIGINESILFQLLDYEEKMGITSYIINAVGSSIVYNNESVLYWCRAKDFYEIAIAWGTIIYNSSAYGGTVFLVPSGWMKTWNEPISAPGEIIK